MAGAGAGGNSGNSVNGHHSAGFQVPDIGSNIGGGGSASEAGGLSQQAPDWFDPNGFLNGAKQQFMTMQKAWDDRDMDAIRETVTDEMYQQLAAERDSMPTDNHTEVVTLNGEILGYTYEPSRVVVSVRMSGMIKEQIGAQAEPFDEIWHVQRSTSDPSANWYVAGIQQNA
jgi:predicted lipid-binding transport protein (Tim44 family)